MYTAVPDLKKNSDLRQDNGKRNQNSRNCYPDNDNSIWKKNRN